MKLKTEYISKKSDTRLYNVEIPIIGLTGGIATGKSTVAKLLADKGFAVISADALVKKIYATSEAFEFVKNNFSLAIEDNKINFRKLRELVFNDSKIKTQIENFIYSKMPTEFLQAVSEFTNPEVIIYDVPLLFEKGLDQKVDLSICVYIPEAEQIQRLMNRDKINRELALKILKEQIAIEDKKKRAQIVLDNSKDLIHLKNKISSHLFPLFN